MKEIVNYLKNPTKVTAPKKWKSSPDSPPTQLAYVTQPEIDMLVKANIHGSMKGKPNKGPNGIMSLDGGGSYKYETRSKKEKEKERATGGNTGADEGPIDSIAADKEYYGDDAFKTSPVRNVRSSTDDSLGKFVTLAKARDERKQVKKPEDLLKILDEQGKKGLTQKELVRIANFIAGNKINKNVLNTEEEASFMNVFDEDRLEEMINSYREGYPNYFKDKTPGTLGGAMGLMDSLTAGKERLDGSDTLSGLKDKLTSSEIAYLKANRPDLYYADSSSKGIGTPGLGGTTQGSLLELSQLDTSNPRLSSNQLRDIYAARETINNQKEAYDSRQTGIMGGDTTAVAPPPPDPDPMIPVDPILFPGTTTPIPTPKYPGSVVNDYTNMGIPNIYGNQQIPTYGYANYNQTGQPVGLQNYLDNLRKRFGIGQYV